MFERIKFLADKRKLSLNEVEERIGLTKNYLYNLKTSKPSSDKIEMLADFFNVSTDYLLGREKIKEEQLDLEELLESSIPFTFGGEEITPHDCEIMKQVIGGILYKKRG